MYLPPNFKNYHPFVYHILCLPCNFFPWWIILKQIPDIILPLNNNFFKARWSHVQWISSVQSLSRVQLFVTPWTAACQASLSITNSRSLLKLMSIESVMSPNYLILCCPLLLLPSVFPASGSFPVSQFFASGGRSIGVSASASVLPMSIQGWFPFGLAGLISFLSKGLSRVFSNTTVHLSKNPVKEITVYLWLVSVTVYLWFVSFFALSTNLKLFFQNIC